jgi:hypothetical protein
MRGQVHYRDQSIPGFPVYRSGGTRLQVHQMQPLRTEGTSVERPKSSMFYRVEEYPVHAVSKFLDSREREECWTILPPFSSEVLDYFRRTVFGLTISGWVWKAGGSVRDS